MDIGTEELSHLEIVGTLARVHLKPMKKNGAAAEVDPLIAIAGGIGPFNSMGDAWTADHLKITGELDVDLRSNIAAEARAKIVYERLIHFTDDAGCIDALKFLMTREITHMKASWPRWRVWAKTRSKSESRRARSGLTSTWTTRPEKGQRRNQCWWTLERGWRVGDCRGSSVQRLPSGSRGRRPTQRKK
jgi:manganese containing catalase